MDDLISKDLAMRALVSSNGDFLLAMDKLEKIPTVDAVLVVHGRWAKSGEYSVCTVCRDFYIATHLCEVGKWQFCPNCGAKMESAE